EKLEDLKLDTFEVGKDKVGILTILPLDNRKEYDIGLPVLSPTLIRKKTLADEIASLGVMSFQTPAASDGRRSPQQDVPVRRLRHHHASEGSRAGLYDP